MMTGEHDGPIVAFSTPAELRDLLGTGVLGGSGAPLVDPDPREPLVRLRGVWAVLGELLALGIVVGATLAVGISSHDFTGFPKGYDALGHLSYTHLLLAHWPHLGYNASWYSGSQMIPGIYGPAYHLVVAAVAWSTGWSLPNALMAVTIGLSLLLVVACYAVVRLLTGARLAGLVAAMVLLATPALWQQTLLLGEYARLMGVAAMAATTAVVVADARRPSRWGFSAAALLGAWALLSHQEAGAFALLLGAGLMVVLDPGPLERRLRRAGCWVVVVLCLVAFLYIPMFLSPLPQYLEDPGSAFSLGHGKPLSFDAVVGIPTPSMASLATAVAPVTALLLGASLLQWWMRRSARGARAPRPELWAALVFMVVPGSVALYDLPDLVPGWRLNLSSFSPTILLVSAAMPLAVVLGICGHDLVTSLPARAARVVGVGGLVASVLLLFAGVSNFAPALSDLEAPHHQLLALLPAAASDGQQLLRVGATNDLVTDWLDDVSTVPQTRGYIEQQLPHHDAQYVLETALTDPRSSLAERRALLEWYGLGWVIAGPSSQVVASYNAEPSLVHPASAPVGSPPFGTFTVVHPSPIVEATAAPTLGVFTPDRATYDLVLDALDEAGEGPGAVVPIEAGASVTGVSATALDRFGAVALVGNLPSLADPSAAVALHHYVDQGGHLFIEAAGDEAPLQALEAAGGPGGVRDVASVSLAQTWDWTFDGRARGSLAALRAHLEHLAPPTPSGSWTVDVANSVPRGAEVEARSAGAPIVVTEHLGRGELTWSGLNLTYHVAVEASTDPSVAGGEAATLVELLQLPAASEPPTTTLVRDAGDGQVSLVAGPGATGVLIKDDLFANFTATVAGRRVGLEPAGPGFIYVPISNPGVQVPVTLRYGLTPIETVSLWCSATMVGLLGLWCVPGPRKVVLRHWRRLRRRLGLAL